MFTKEDGATMLESVAAVAVLGIAGVALITALATAAMTSGKVSDRVQAAEIVSRQIEYTKTLPYQVAPNSYDTVEVVAPYSVTCQSAPLAEGNQQKLVVTVYKNGQSILLAEDYKVNR